MILEATPEVACRFEESLLNTREVLFSISWSRYF